MIIEDEGVFDAAPLQLDDLAGAERAAADALRTARREKDEPATARALLEDGRVALARGRANYARQRLNEAQRAFARLGDAPRRVQCAFLLGEIAYAGEDPIRAGALYREGLAIAREIGAADAVELLMLRFEHR